MKIKNETRTFQGRELELVNIAEYEECALGENLVFEVVSGDFWRRFRYGYLIARTTLGPERLTPIIKAYQKAYPAAQIYLSPAH